MIRTIMILCGFMLVALPASAQDAATEASCRISEFIEDNGFSAIYDSENAQVNLNAELGSVASCTASPRLKRCFYTFVERARAYVELYNRGQNSLNDMQIVLRAVEITKWHYKVETTFFSTKFSEIQFGDFLSNELNARSQFMINGVGVNVEKLQELLKDGAYWNAFCSLGTVSEESFKTAWDTVVAKREARDAPKMVVDEKERQEKEKLFEERSKKCGDPVCFFQLRQELGLPE
jgi:hypothetical protein